MSPANLSALMDSMSSAYRAGTLITGGITLAFWLLLRTRTGEPLRRTLGESYLCPDFFCEVLCGTFLLGAFVNLLFFSNMVFLFSVIFFLAILFVMFFLMMFAWKEMLIRAILFFLLTTIMTTIYCFAYNLINGSV